MNKTKIDWADYTWNPVTGCLNTCEYCYARKMSKRFAADVRLNLSDERCKRYKGTENLYILSEPFLTKGKRGLNYPFGFVPTFHEYRLDWIEKIKTGSNIFVCSMADLFGDWVADEWITKVFESCKNNPCHNYLFLTKNPKRYRNLFEKKLLPLEDNFWYGSAVTIPEDEYFENNTVKTFLSIEPIHSTFLKEEQEICSLFPGIDWIIVGAETGNRKGKVVPEKSWINNLTKWADMVDVPVFMKESLRDLMGDDFKQVIPGPLKYHAVQNQKDRLHDCCGICKQGYAKKDMTAILYREKRKASCFQFGYLCRNCFIDLKTAFEKEKPVVIIERELVCNSY